MKIAVLANAYPQLSETFVRREVGALEARGHVVYVFMAYESGGPLVPRVGTPVYEWTDKHIRDVAPEVIYASLGMMAHERALQCAYSFNIPFALRIWEGFDAFTRPSPGFYMAATTHLRSLGVVVEDDWMQQYAVEKMRIEPGQIYVVPNSIDVERFRPVPRSDGPPIVLAVARFVKKKGLIHLIRAFRRLEHPTAILRLVGYGDEHLWLRSEAGPNVEFMGPVPESDLPALYQSATIFAAPCVQERNGDADGIPTTVLESMACGCTVIASDILSASCYVKHGETGYLVKPGDDVALADTIGMVLSDRTRETGQAARTFAVDKLDLATNICAIERILERGNRAARWQAGINGIHLSRQRRSAASNINGDKVAADCTAILDIQGDVLDMGCGDTSWRGILRDRITSYLGIDVTPLKVPDAPWFQCADCDEPLPFSDAQFDTVLCYSVLQHLRRPDLALTEARRVLRPGGRLAIQVPVEDRNPIFLWWWNVPEMLALIKSVGFTIRSHEVIYDRALTINGVK